MSQSERFLYNQKLDGRGQLQSLNLSTPPAQSGSVFAPIDKSKGVLRRFGEPEDKAGFSYGVLVRPPVSPYSAS